MTCKYCHQKIEEITSPHGFTTGTLLVHVDTQLQHCDQAFHVGPSRSQRTAEAA